MSVGTRTAMVVRAPRSAADVVGVFPARQNCTVTSFEQTVEPASQTL
jgi:hypothetical protein